MRTRLAIATAAGVAALLGAAPAHAGSCAPGSADGNDKIPLIVREETDAGNAYVYSTIPDNPLAKRHRGAAGVTTDVGYVETFGASPTKDGHVHGDLYGSGVDFDVALGQRPDSSEPANVTRACVGGTQVIGDEYGYTPPAP